MRWPLTMTMLFYDDVIFSSPNFKHKDRPEVSRAIFSGSGILFDPDVVSAFLNVVFHNLKIG